MNTILKCEIIKKFGTQADFAAAAGIQESVVSGIVRTRRTLSEKEAKRWCGVLGFPEDRAIELFDETWG